MTESLSVASLFAYAYAGIAFVGGLFPDAVVAGAAGITATCAAVAAHFILQRRAEAQRGRPTHCEHIWDITPDEAHR